MNQPVSVATAKPWIAQEERPFVRIQKVTKKFGDFTAVDDVSFTAHAATKPNIIFIMADDLGWTDLGVQGSKYYETPNIDRLATAGMRFTDYYAGAPNDKASRCVLMTGLNCRSRYRAQPALATKPPAWEICAATNGPRKQVFAKEARSSQPN